MTKHRGGGTSPPKPSNKRSKVRGRMVRPPSEATSMSEDMTVTLWTIFWIYVSLCAFLYDYVADIRLIVNYFWTLEPIYGLWALFLTVIPGFARTWVSHHMRQLDNQKAQAEKLNVQAREQQVQKSFIEKRAEQEHCGLLDVLSLFKFSPLIDYLRYRSYAHELRDSCQRKDGKNRIRHNYSKFLKQQEDVALLSIVGGFLEAAPQLNLQLYILRLNGVSLATFASWMKILGSFITLVSLGWSGRSYHCNIRLAQHDKAKVTCSGTVMLFLWNFGTTISRIALTQIALWMSVWYTILAYGVIWLGWTAWIYYKKDGVLELYRGDTTSTCTEITWKERIIIACISAIFSVVYFHMYVNLSEGPTLYKYLCYYTLWGIQIVIVNAVWFSCEIPAVERDWYSFAVLLLSTVSFIVGIVSMLIYHTFLHPTINDEKSTIPDSNIELTHSESIPKNKIEKIKEKIIILSNVQFRNQ